MTDWLMLWMIGNSWPLAFLMEVVVVEVAADLNWTNLL
jgi:hypothetical protein